MPSIGKSSSRHTDYEAIRHNMQADQPNSPHSSTPQFGSPTFASQPSPASSSNRHSESKYKHTLHKHLICWVLQVLEKEPLQITPALAQSCHTLVSPCIRVLHPACPHTQADTAQSRAQMFARELRRCRFLLLFFRSSSALSRHDKNTRELCSSELMATPFWQLRGAGHTEANIRQQQTGFDRCHKWFCSWGC